MPPARGSGAQPLPRTEATAPEAAPVMLATLSVRIDAAAERMAVETAKELGSRLIVANMLGLRPYPLTVALCREWATLPSEEHLEAVRATAERARAAGVPTTLMRVSSPRPIAALLELAREERAGLVVFGPDRERIGRVRLRASVRALRRGVPCLLWIPSSA